MALDSKGRRLANFIASCQKDPFWSLYFVQYLVFFPSPPGQVSRQRWTRAYMSILTFLSVAFRLMAIFNLRSVDVGLIDQLI
jgi:hypothetical protein